MVTWSAKAAIRRTPHCKRDIKPSLEDTNIKDPRQNRGRPPRHSPPPTTRTPIKTHL